jgi:hypothetical protein
MLLMSQRNVGTSGTHPVENQLTLGAVGIRINTFNHYVGVNITVYSVRRPRIIQLKINSRLVPLAPHYYLLP